MSICKQALAAFEHRERIKALTAKRNATTCEEEQTPWSHPEDFEPWAIDAPDGYWEPTMPEVAPCWKQLRDWSGHTDLGVDPGSPPTLCAACLEREALTQQIRDLKRSTGGRMAALWTAVAREESRRTGRPT